MARLPGLSTHLHFSVELALLLTDDRTDDAVVPGEPSAIEVADAAVVIGVVADFGPTASGPAPAWSSSRITCLVGEAIVCGRDNKARKRMNRLDECGRRREKGGKLFFFQI